MARQDKKSFDSYYFIKKKYGTSVLGQLYTFLFQAVIGQCYFQSRLWLVKFLIQKKIREAKCRICFSCIIWRGIVCYCFSAHTHTYLAQMHSGHRGGSRSLTVLGTNRSYSSDDWFGLANPAISRICVKSVRQIFDRL